MFKVCCIAALIVTGIPYSFSDYQNKDEMVFMWNHGKVCFAHYYIEKEVLREESESLCRVISSLEEGEVENIDKNTIVKNRQKSLDLESVILLRM